MIRKREISQHFQRTFCRVESGFPQYLESGFSAFPSHTKQKWKPHFAMILKSIMLLNLCYIYATSKRGSPLQLVCSRQFHLSGKNKMMVTILNRYFLVPYVLNFQKSQSQWILPKYIEGVGWAGNRKGDSKDTVHHGYQQRIWWVLKDPVRLCPPHSLRQALRAR